MPARKSIYDLAHKFIHGDHVTKFDILGKTCNMTDAQKRRFNYYYDIADDDEWEKIFELEDDPKRHKHYLDIKGLALDRIKTLKKFVPP